MLEEINKKINTYYYIGDVEYNNYYLKIELLPENKDQLHMFVIFNSKIIQYSQTDESFRSDLWVDECVDLVIFNEESELIPTILQNSSYLYKEEDLKHFSIKTSDTVIDIISLEDPIIVMSDNSYNESFNYRENYGEDTNERKVYDYMLPYKYNKTYNLLENFKIDGQIPYELTEIAVTSEENIMEYESLYMVKGELNEEREMFIEGLNIEFIKSDNVNLNQGKYAIENPYFVIKINNLELLKK